MNCFNCSSSVHVVRDFKRPNDLTRKVNALLTKKRTYDGSMLYGICQQWEGDEDADLLDNESECQEVEHNSDKESHYLQRRTS